MRKLMLFLLALAVGVSALSSSSLAEDEQAEEILQRAIKAVGGEGHLRSH